MHIIDLNPNDIYVADTGIREEIGDVTGLATTIADQGMLQPLGVMLRPSGSYQLVYGHRRRSAAISLGLSSVPCLVLADDDRHLIRQLTENLQRRDLNDLEQARAFARLRQQFQLRQPDSDEGTLDDLVAQTVGLSARSVRRYLGLLDLEESIQAYLRSGQLTVTQAQHLRRITNPQNRIELARAAVDEGMSAVELSRLASFFAANPDQSLDSAVHALQQPQTNGSIQQRTTTEAPIDDENDTAWHASRAQPKSAPHDDFSQDTAAINSHNRLRPLRFKHLTQINDETERMLQFFTHGQLQELVDKDDAAPQTVQAIVSNLRHMITYLTNIARAEQWPIDSD